MSDYEYNRQQRERRNNARRLAYAMYSAIGGAWCQEKSADITPAVQQLARILNYLPEQLVEDIKALEDYTREKACEDADRDAEEAEQAKA